MILTTIKKILNPRVYVFKYTKYVVSKKYRPNIGQYSYGYLNIMDWGEGATLKIGKFCSFAKNVTIILGGEHRADWVTMYPFSGEAFHRVWPEAKVVTGHPKSKGDVIIGNDVWVGYGATILSGVIVGDGTVIGAHSLVTRDVAPYTIVAGNPAKLMRKRFSDKIVRELLRIKWWEWPEGKIRKNIKSLLSGDIESFIDAN